MHPNVREAPSRPIATIPIRSRRSAPRMDHVAALMGSGDANVRCRTDPLIAKRAT